MLFRSVVVADAHCIVPGSAGVRVSAALPRGRIAAGRPFHGFHHAHGLGMVADTLTGLSKLPSDSPPVPYGAVLQNA